MIHNIQSISHRQHKNQTWDMAPQLLILQHNIEAISCNKAKYLSRLLHDNKINVLLLQETHAEKEDLLNRDSIAGFRLTHHIPQ